MKYDFLIAGAEFAVLFLLNNAKQKAKPVSLLIKEIILLVMSTQRI